MVDTTPREYPGLHNVVAFRDDYLSGSVPEGEKGFDSLAALGVKTIITVDGSEPEVDKARARGMRYIHLPIGYNGFGETRKRELARATRDALANGPVYIHCHHGKHRSAGAAATVGGSLGWYAPQTGIDRMKVSGTSPGYKGLYACAASATIISDAELDAVPGNFPEVSPPEGFVKSMVSVDHATEHLKAIEKAGWATPADHPDLVPVAEAGLLADLLRVLCDNERTKATSAEFQASMKQNADEVQTLEDMLGEKSHDRAALSAQFKLIIATCKDCHMKFRD